MLNLLINLFKEMTLFVGYIKNNAYLSPLTEKEEDNYVNEWLNNKDMLSRNKLIEHNLRLVAHIAKKYESDVDSLDDLISIGTIGLIKAVDSYSLNKGVRIATYASKCIENELLMHMRTNRKISKNISLNETIGSDKDGADITLLDILPTESSFTYDNINLNENIIALRKYLSILEPRELEIIKLRFGLDNNEELTQKEVAKKFGISRSYVSRIEKRAYIKLLQEFKKARK